MRRITELELLRPSCRARAVLMTLAIAIPALSASPGRAEEVKSFCDSYLLQGLEDALGPQWEEFLAVLAKTGEEAKEALGKGGAIAGKVGGVVGLAKINADAVYASLIAYGVRVNFLTPDNQIAHLGPPGSHPSTLGEAGKSIRFTVSVTMNINVPEAIRTCAADLGYKIPKPGPVGDIPIAWSPELLSEDLSHYGTVTYEPANQKTNENGTSTAIFTPNSEFENVGIVGLGKEVTRSGTILADPLVLTGLNDSAVYRPGNIPQLFWGVTAKWQVAYHQARGLKFPEAHFETRRMDGFTTDWWVSGWKCGPTPWYTSGDSLAAHNPKAHWTIDHRLQSTLKGWRSATKTNSHSQSMYRSENGSTWDIGSSGKITFMIQPSYPPKMAIEMTPWNGYPLTTQSVVTVPITEDANCP